jgi:hypothetical protein
MQFFTILKASFHNYMNILHLSKILEVSPPLCQQLCESSLKVLLAGQQGPAGTATQGMCCLKGQQSLLQFTNLQDNTCTSGEVSRNYGSLKKLNGDFQLYLKLSYMQSFY